MKYCAFVFLIFLACNGIGLNEERTNLESSTLSNAGEADSTIVATFNINDTKNQVVDHDDHLFGKFYHDRIEFHIVDRPDIKILNTPVKRMTLYFIDSVLCKKKYELEENISNKLMNSLGSFKFQPIGMKSLEAAKMNGVIVYQPNGALLNPHLASYQMKWALEDRTVIFRHEEDSLAESNTYEEQLAEYKRLFNSAKSSIN